MASHLRSHVPTRGILRLSKNLDNASPTIFLALKVDLKNPGCERWREIRPETEAAVQEGKVFDNCSRSICSSVKV